MAFEEVGSATMQWEPKQSGTKETGIKIKQPTDKSFIDGYYIGTKYDVGKNKSQVHSLKFVAVGNPDDISGESAAGTVSIWGNGVLDSKIAENVTPGMLIRIQWKGLTQPKKAGGNEYHDFALMIDKTAEPMEFTPLPEDLNPKSGSGNNSPAEAMNSDDDDLPF